MNIVMDGEQATKKLRCYLREAKKLDTRDTFQAHGGSLQFDFRGFYRVCIQVCTVADTLREARLRGRQRKPATTGTVKRRYIRWKVYITGHCECLGDYRICPECNGNHYVQSRRTGHMEKCPHCKGDGFLPYA